MDSNTIACIYSATDPEQVEKELVSIWEVLKQHPEFQEEAGIGESEIENLANPFTAARAAEGSGVVAAILIAGGGRIAGEILVRLWDQQIWPRLQTRLPGIRQGPPVD